MYALAIHTASADLGLALSNFDDLTRCQTWALGREVSTHLHLHLAEFLPPQIWSDLAFLAVAKGAGSFTGTRIGVVTARTLAQQLKIPLFGISTLAAIAQAHLTSPFKPADSETTLPDLAVQMLAQRGEVHVAIYSPELKPLLEDTVMSQAQWQQTLETWARPYHLMTAADGLGTTTPALLDLAYRDWQRGDRPDWSTVLPFYGQSPV
ncbi:MAG: tRNA (adenosine(37)-N6)-threonylcarbamoyltransferase complex dimerization subunit type 1 TsaB [Drouetiella hepatica Uher 2000/2452]|jgi:tRNA threonylcarbamoyl adenosine modification protein YeaZ|uniref:tRNA (Adenosine(37)-N6)-threonylcarbamoyltransferase complex dimerization subunit type 1 TsaB n=1 Tax=Drouetiella hepatica Uher 2000/2452 TaxID=904376 RepID=A0A951QCB7_9CYAN|nr:tRNA (adenosine(37)-N6)-threonylcarbamoyltransferase complex dimerization subunit type 1 TsaB [Drouetiella hepatica Uher 2000/2452]